MLSFLRLWISLLECALLVSVRGGHLSFFLPKVTHNCRSSFYVTEKSPLFLEGGNLSDSSLLATSSFPKSCIDSLSPVLHLTCLIMTSSLSWVQSSFSGSCWATPLGFRTSLFDARIDLRNWKEIPLFRDLL